MSPDKDKALVEKYPLLFASRRSRGRKSISMWGFECGDGWYDLIDRLAAKLEPMIAALPPNEQGDVRAAQVKEKWGTLRFYMSSHLAGMDAAIDEAEAESARVCEDCGKPGELRSGGWIRTLCNDCAFKRDNPHDNEAQA